MGSTTNGNVLYEDNFLVDDINPEGQSSKVFKNIGRLIARGTTYDVSMVVDVNTELFPVKLKDRLAIALATSLDLSGAGGTGEYNQSGKPTLLDKFDYGMHGKIFQVDAVDEHKMAVYVSYGGLLMKMVGDQRHLSVFELDTNIYCLIKLEERGT